MKLLLVLSFILFGVQSFAIEHGFYECEALEEGSDESYTYDIQLFKNSITFFEGEVPDVEYVMGQKSDSFKEIDLSKDNDQETFGMYYFKYKFYQEPSSGDLTFTYQTKYIDSEATVDSTSVISQIDEETIQIIETFEMDNDGEVFTVNAVCTQTEG